MHKAVKIIDRALDDLTWWFKNHDLNQILVICTDFTWFEIILKIWDLIWKNQEKIKSSNDFKIK